MSSERTRPSFIKAEEWINPLLERGRKIDAIKENVDTIRTWATNIKPEPKGEYTQFSKRRRFLNGRNRISFTVQATDKQDLESEVGLDFAAKIEMKLDTYPPNGSQVLSASFKYDLIDPVDQIETEDIEYRSLFCELYVVDNTADDILIVSGRLLTDLKTDELEAVYNLTNMVVGFVPPPSPTQFP